MNAPYTSSSVSVDVSSLSGKTFGLERCGRYEEALELFGEDYSDGNFVPRTQGLSLRDAGELLLRFGALLGFYNFKYQVPDGQLRPKNILTRALKRFERLGEVQKMAECQIYIALCYWRDGEQQDARVWIDTSLAHDLPMSSDTRLYAHVIRSLILVSLKEHETNIVNCKAVEEDFCKYAAPVLRAGIYANLGISLKNVGQLSEATRYLTLARIFHAKARHKVYLATIYNNLAQLYKEQERFPEAHDSVDAAIKIYRQLKDHNREGSSLDTKAQIYLYARDLKNALAAVDRSIAILKKSGDSDFLAESLLTRAKVLLFQDHFADAVLSLVDAVNIVRFRNGEKAGYHLIGEFRRVLDETKMFTDGNRSIEPDELELILPAPLAHYTDYRGIWINSGHLESFGIRSGSLAVAVQEELNRGDLAAITDLDTGNVICGIYDAEFGIVAIQRSDEEPMLFDQNKIHLIGKIVGVCTGETDGDGKMKVAALKL